MSEGGERLLFAELSSMLDRLNTLRIVLARSERDFSEDAVNSLFILQAYVSSQTSR